MFIFFLIAHYKCAYQTVTVDGEKASRYRDDGWIYLAGPLLVCAVWMGIFGVTVTAETLGYPNPWTGAPSSLSHK